MSELDDKIDAWFFSIGPECRACVHCGDFIARAEAGDHFDGRCLNKVLYGDPPESMGMDEGIKHGKV